MTLGRDDKAKLQSYLETKVGRPDRLVSELRELLKERSKDSLGKVDKGKFIKNLEWIYVEGAKRIRNAPTWNEVGQIMSLIFDVAQDIGLGLIKKNREVKEAIKLKVQIAGVPTPKSPYFEKFRYTMGLMGIKISGRDVKRSPQTIKKPIFFGLLGSKEVEVESTFYDKVWDIPSKEEILAQL